MSLTMKEVMQSLLAGELVRRKEWRHTGDYLALRDDGALVCYCYNNNHSFTTYLPKDILDWEIIPRKKPPQIKLSINPAAERRFVQLMKELHKIEALLNEALLKNPERTAKRKKKPT